jgi:ribonucleoside-diphosphate reductase beta chain
MAETLLELTQQGDPGTLESSEAAARIQLLDPQALYELWERQQWASSELDFTRDREDWARLDGEIADDIVWGLSSFFIGEERVTTQFSGLVMAYEDEAEEAYLTTQQVDEARHMQFFDRFYREVVGLEDPTFGDRLQRVRGALNDAFVKLFDEELVAAGRVLIEDPSSIDAKVDFVTAYHMVIEGTLALTGQNFITEYFEREGILPGFVEGFRNVSRDEHRHVAYGTWYLQQACRRDPRLAGRMRAKLLELLPVASGVLVPKGHSPEEEWTLLGYSSTEVNGFAFNALSRRLKAIGVPLVAGVESAPSGVS